MSTEHVGRMLALGRGKDVLRSLDDLIAQIDTVRGGQ